MQIVKTFLSRHQKRIRRICAVTLCLAILSVALAQTAKALTTYVITDGDMVLVHRTFETDPAEVLTQVGLTLGAEDTYTAQTEDGVSSIQVNRLQTLRVMNGTEEKSITTYGTTVRQILAEVGVEAGENILVSAAPDSMTFDGMELRITYLTYALEEEVEEEPFETVYCSDPSLEPGQEMILTEGQPGRMVNTTRITLENGREIGRTLMERRVLTPAVPALVARGVDRSARLHRAEEWRKPIPAVPTRTVTAASAKREESPPQSAPAETKPQPVPEEPASQPVPEDTSPQPESTEPPVDSGNTLTTASGDVVRYSRKLSVEATAYSCEGYTGITATGTTARYGAIAVDPRVIPYGTRMYIVSDDGVYIYGYATAEDCGGGIKGNRIDLYFDTEDECWDFGRRSCTVYILE